MLLTTKIKFLPNTEQFKQLKDTMNTFNRACNRISEIAFENKTYSKIKIQKICYYDVREEFKLPSQLVIRAIAKVAEAYKVNKKSLRKFRLDGAVIYDERILSFKGIECASISTMYGRISIPMQISSYHKGVLEGKRIRGQADLVLIDGVFYLLLVVEFPNGTPIETEDVIGLDLGIVNIVTDSDGKTFSGAKINNLRKRYARIRAKLQAKQTKSAKRLLKKRRRKEQRMAKDINHCISKQIVEKAVRHSSAIALENLNGIAKKKQKSKTVIKSQRSKLSNWSFYQLQQFIKYKAEQRGVTVLFVDPQHTSQTCSCCGHVTKENRKTQANFECVSCGYVAHADYNASLNIREKGYCQLAERRSA
ncbi:IS200/IS605 family element transposase accessory protein TnpB [Bacillus glycinifermentans]|uniref:RNA-guided endonuclease InsQ/TnpB family protein n=1 Tax=Bacillus TaxID=1386 RepID=UPI001582A393|nr:RNA-guided endonuclease TnpB family protein [Bacillus sonorensis]MCY7858912.1 transposase [Bacillus sonorensis]NUJ16895.1 IS200/IS605 family element transposase accessory protein TnpB [Bacillus glycinifermentans]GIN67539.1 transposase [Bacillus sonorensis]